MTLYKALNGVKTAMTASEEAVFVASLPHPAALGMSDYQVAIQTLIDKTAVSKQYADGVTLASYANSTNAAWAAQAAAFIAWRDAVWIYVYDALNEVQAGQRSQPTIEAFLAELPAINWP